MNFAPTGLIEYVDKKDETVKQMLSLKRYISNYNLKEFENIISLNGKILEKTVITETRILYEFKKINILTFICLFPVFTIRSNLNFFEISYISSIFLLPPFFLII